MFTKIHRVLRCLKVYLYDFFNDLKYSTVVHGSHFSKDALLASMAVQAHTIEKGLTMPNKHWNFGAEKIVQIASDLFYCADHFDDRDSRFANIVGILKEYKFCHNVNNVEIKNQDVKKWLGRVESKWPSIPRTSQLYDVSKDSFFAQRTADFYVFSQSRHSCRSFEEPVDENDLKKALDLAVKTTPSTCNRQSVKVHVISSKEILNIQQGNRGFGHLADKYLLLTSSLSHWPSLQQRNAPYVDGGIFLMNLLYALHYYQIAACTLNMYLSKGGTKNLNKVVGIPEDETPIALIAIGTPSAKFDIAKSVRKSFDEVVVYHKTNA